MSKPARIPDNLKAPDIEFTPGEIKPRDETFAIDDLQGDHYPEALSGLVPS